MSKSIAISKIRCLAPNKHNTALLNRNHLNYVATREGVDLSPPVSREDDNSIYMRYIHERPRSHGLFGNLPSHEIDNLDELCSNMYQMSKSKPIFKGILSLKEEDALALGYDKREKWETTLRASLPAVAEQLNIPPTALKWVAAFHQEKGHPHAHYMLWADDDKIRTSYIHVTQQQKCREIFSKHIFSEERAIQVMEKTIARDDIIASGKSLIRDEIEKMYVPGTGSAEIPDRFHYENLSALSEQLIDFCGTLPSHGRLAYKYLPPEQKDKLNHIVDNFLSQTPLKQKYDNYVKSVKDITKSYSVVGAKAYRNSSKADADLKSRLGNIVLKELKNFRLAVDDTYTENALQYKNTIPVISGNKHSDISSINMDNPSLQENFPDNSLKDSVDDINTENALQYKNIISATEDSGSDYIMKWTKEYKKARSLIYDKATKETIQKGIYLLEKEAAQNNVLAIYELAHVYEAGLIDGDENHDKETIALYARALDGFESLYTQMPKSQNYIAYRIGKQYMRGQGCDIDLHKSAQWFEDSSNQYAEYSLAKIYLGGNPSASDEKIIALLQDSSSQGFGYASYQLGSLYESGKLVSINNNKAYDYYQKALTYFLENSQSATDSSIFFRLGTMYYRGKGTEVNIEDAKKYFEKAANLGNINALLSLSKIYTKQKDFTNLDTTVKKIEQQLNKLNLMNEKDLTDFQKELIKLMHYYLAQIYINDSSPFFNIERGLYYFQIEAADGNEFAQYQLGKIFSQDNFVPKDLNIAVSYLTDSAEQGNSDAQYALGKIYCNKEESIFDIPKAIKFLDDAASQGHSFAQYQLGKIFSDAELSVYDSQKSITYFTASAEQGNVFAQYQLGKLYFSEDMPCFDLTLALKFLNAAADQNHEQALYKLGTIYANKNYPTYDIQKALKFYLRAIDEFDNSFAKYQLGRMYLFGDGVDKNVVLGMEYLKSASDSGNEYATALISYYKQNQTLSVSYTISRGMFDVLVNQIHQNQMQQQELAHATASKKNRKEAVKKNQIKSSEPE